MKKALMILIPVLVSCGSTKSGKSPAPVPPALTCSPGMIPSPDQSTCVDPSVPSTVTPTPIPTVTPAPADTRTFEEMCHDHGRGTAEQWTTIYAILGSVGEYDCSKAAAKLVNTESLTLNLQVGDLFPLTKLSHLKSLTLTSSATNYAALGALSSLESLSINEVRLTDQDLDILASLPRLTTLALENAVSVTNEGLKKIGQVSGLRFLTIIKNEQITSLDNIRSLEQLEALHLSGLTKIASLAEQVAGFTGVKSLELPDYSGSLAFLKAFQELRKLTVSTLTADFDPEDLAQLAKLEEFNGTCDSSSRCLSGLPKPESLKRVKIEVTNGSQTAAVSRFTQLESLNFMGLKADADLLALKDLTRLKTLFMVCTNETLSSLSGLEGMKDLEHLFLRCRGVKSLNGLGNKPKIASIVIGGLHLEDVSELVRFSYPALKSLEIHISKNVTELEALKALTALEVLQVGGGSITDFNFLSQLTALKTLRTVLTQLSDLEPLRKLQNLQSLWILGHALVSDLRPVAGLKNLKDLRITVSKVTSETCPKDAESPGVTEYCKKEFP